MDRDIVGAIEVIDGRIARLSELRKQLAEEFGIAQKTHVSSNQKSLFEKSREKTRKEELADYLKANGPKTRMEIVKQTGIPPGTVSFLLEGQTVRQERGRELGPCEEYGREWGCLIKQPHPLMNVGLELVGCRP